MKKLWEVWELEDKIGQGSFGEVYIAHKKELGQDFYSAVKHISLPKSQDEVEEIIREGYATTSDDILEYYKDTIDDLVKEIKIMYELRANKNIVDYQDHLIIEKSEGDIGYDIYIRMELLTSLDRHLEESKMDEKEIINLGLDITEALIVCNNHNLLHRDIKPANIFIDKNGIYKLGDFGVARKLEKTTYGMSKKGTYNYMSPEIYKGEKANISSDIYSLGIVMYRLLNNNKQPFIDKDKTVLKVSDNEEALMKRMNGEEIPDIEKVNPSLMKVIKKACNYDRNKRYKTPSDMKKDLERIKNGESLEEEKKEEKVTKTEDPLDKTVSIYGDQDDILEKTVSIYSQAEKGNESGYTSDDELRNKIRRIIEEETVSGTLKNEKKYVTVKTYKEKPDIKYIALSFVICVILLAANVLSTEKNALIEALSQNAALRNFEFYYDCIILTDFIVLIGFLISLVNRKAQKVVSYFYMFNVLIYIMMNITLFSNNYRVTYLFYLMLGCNVLLYFINYKWSLKVISKEVEEEEKDKIKENDEKLEQQYDKPFSSKKEIIISIVFIMISIVSLVLVNLTPLKEQQNPINASEKQIKVKEEFINIRKEPTSKSEKVGTVYKDEVYTVIDEKNKKDGYNDTVIWYHIKTELGTEGYIASYESSPWVEVISEG